MCCKQNSPAKCSGLVLSVRAELPCLTFVIFQTAVSFTDLFAWPFVIPAHVTSSSATISAGTAVATKPRHTDSRGALHCARHVRVCQILRDITRTTYVCLRRHASSQGSCLDPQACNTQTSRDPESQSRTPQALVHAAGV